MALHSKNSERNSSGVLSCEMRRLQMDSNKFFASIPTGQDKPFDLLRTLYEGSIAGAAAGVIVEAAAHGGGSIILKDLYSGLAGNLVGSLPASAICVGVYEPAKQTLLASFPEKLSALAHLTAGFIGGAASSLIRVPTEVVKQRMQTGQFASAPDAVRLIVAKEGFKGLYAGYGSFLLRDLPFDAIQFCMYEQLRIGYKLAARRELSDLETAMIGAFAGAITGAITTPLDVIKTRLMVQGSAKQYKGICDCVRTIMRQEGNHVFFKGTAPRVLWIGIGGSIFFGVLERTKQMLARRHPAVQKSPSFDQDSKL
ncbi:Mitochondrial carrier domain containing protein [Trema orientale]|uniref:Mitochondrial carrier domain containing protein n=1 Tax=Trema orientale TaxID=63057 RepID=A0A2P5FEQ2_TREOI|nr:Mitochondrial carrier domain containing protein [Trema orientale]